MSTDDTRPYLLDELGRTVVVDEYLSGELPDGWTANRGDETDEIIIRSGDVDLSIHVKPDCGKEAVQLCRDSNCPQSELVIQKHVDGLDARKMAYDIAISWTYVIVTTISEVTDE
jgi:hypothetical protein